MALIYEVKKTTLNFKKEKPVVYKVAAVRQQTVKYDALVKEVASSCGVHRRGPWWRDCSTDWYTTWTWECRCGWKSSAHSNRPSRQK